MLQDNRLSYRARVGRTLILALTLAFCAIVAEARPVTASWDANTDGITVSYRLFYGTAPNTYTVEVPVGNVTSHPLNLVPGFTYYFVVRAYDSLDQPGPASDEASITLANAAPVLTNPGTLNNATGAVVSLQLVATDPNGDALTFGVTGLPTGLTLNPNTGLISGTISAGASGSFTVNATATDGNLADLEVFAWNVSDGALLVTPACGSTLTSGSQTFAWTAGTGVIRYWLDVGTTGAGSFDVVSRDAGSQLSTFVTGLPAGSVTLYVRLWSLTGTVWSHFNCTVTSAPSVTSPLAQLTTPAPAATLPSVSQTFAWSAGTGVTRYWLDVGTSAPGSSEILSFDAGTLQSRIITGLPTTSATIHVRLWSLIGTTWAYNDYTVTSASASSNALLSTPAPGATLSAVTETFSWTPGTGVTQYWIDIGTTGVSSADIVSRPMGLGLSTIVTGLPTGGGSIYVRLFSLVGGTWNYGDYVLTSAATSPRAQLTQPVPGTTLANVSQQFCWTAGTGVSRYWLDIGTVAAGDFSLLSRDADISTCTPVTGLPEGGQTLYVRLFSLITGVWSYFDYTVTSPRRAQLINPTPGSTLGLSSYGFAWSTGTGATRYFLDVGTTGAGSFNITSYDAGGTLSTTVVGLPTSGATVNVRLWSFLDGAWAYVDYTFPTP